jgi:hypothetical protein
VNHVTLPAEDRCVECGALVAGGQTACQGAFEHLNALALSNFQYARVHRLVVDAFCMQHVLPYARSVKSYAAHLAGLCCGVERGGDIAVYDAIPRWLSGSGPLDVTRPSPPALRGAMTVHAITHDSTPEQHRESVERWARLVWGAYAKQHALERQWVDLAMRTSRRR